MRFFVRCFFFLYVPPQSCINCLGCCTISASKRMEHRCLLPLLGPSPGKPSEDSKSEPAQLYKQGPTNKRNDTHTHIHEHAFICSVFVMFVFPQQNCILYTVLGTGSKLAGTTLCFFIHLGTHQEASDIGHERHNTSTSLFKPCLSMSQLTRRRNWCCEKLPHGQRPHML